MSSDATRWETTSRPSEVDSGSWAALFDLEDGQESPWHEEELASILAHQLKAPLHFELQGLPSGTRRLLRAAGEIGGTEARLNTYGDLFRHPEPPLILLILVKRFAKAHQIHPSGVIPPQVTAVLYYGCIALADVRWNRLISSLANDQLIQGLRAVLSYDWVPNELKAVLRLALIRRSNGQADGTRPAVSRP